MAAAPASSLELINLLNKSGLVSPEKLGSISELSLPSEPPRAAAMLIEQGFVTRFQAQQLLAGRHRGFCIGGYVILDMLGRGGMGAVYLAEHKELHRKVAMKILVPGKNEDQKLALERFLREARSVAALDHPNIVRIFDVSRHQDVPFLIMEYVQGDTLQQMLDREGAIPYPNAAEHIAQAAAGLQHAHEKGFVHRDIKPGNLILDKSGTIKILDMGLARSASSQDKLTEKLDHGAVVGTADYIAPEQALNQPTVDIRADIYSLGATFFALIIGKPPFEGNTTQKLLQHQLRSAPRITAMDQTLPKGLSAVVAKMLAKKPADRYQSPVEVIAALAPWMNNSSRILAGLSRTSLAQGANLQAALADVGHSNSRRLKPKRQRDEDGPDSANVDPSDASNETGAMTASMTTRERRRVVRKEKRAKQKRNKLYALLGGAVFVATVIAGWLAFGGKTATTQQTLADPRSREAQEKSPGPAQGNPNASVQKPGDDPERVLYQTEFARQKPFVIHSGLSVDPLDAQQTTYRQIAQSGIGVAPTGWRSQVWNKDSQMEFFADESSGKPALGFRNVAGPGSAMLFMPEFECSTGVCRLRFEYSAPVRDGRFTVRFKPADNRGAWDIIRPPVTGATWRTEELEVDLKGATRGFFEFHNADTSPNSAIRFRSVSVLEVSRTTGDRVLFRLDASDLPAFKNAKLGMEKSSGDNDPRLPGVYFGGYKKETQSEWMCGPIDGVKAIGYTNLNEIKSAQIGIELESAQGIGARLDPGQRLRLRVTYRTAGQGRGNAYIQSFGDWAVLQQADLTNSNGEWKTVDIETTRGEKPLRCVVDVTETGSGNTLYVRSVEVLLIGKGAPSPAPSPAPRAPTTPGIDHTNWAEGPVAYKLDLAKIPTFRQVKEQFNRTSGDPEQLPIGIGCQAWKERAIAEFRCEKIEGEPALAITNLNDEMSGQFFFQLEGEMKLPLQPGKVYRVKVSYLTKNDGVGNVNVQVTPGYEGIGSVDLPNTAGQWKSAAASFVRPSTESRVEVRMTIDNTSVGEGNSLWVRSVELVELLPPEKK